MSQLTFPWPAQFCRHVGQSWRRSPEKHGVHGLYFVPPAVSTHYWVCGECKGRTDKEILHGHEGMSSALPEWIQRCESLEPCLQCWNGKKSSTHLTPWQGVWCSTQWRQYDSWRGKEGERVRERTRERDWTDANSWLGRILCSVYSLIVFKSSGLVLSNKKHPEKVLFLDLLLLTVFSFTVSLSPTHITQ